MVHNCNSSQLILTLLLVYYKWSCHYLHNSNCKALNTKSDLTFQTCVGTRFSCLICGEIMKLRNHKLEKVCILYIMVKVIPQQAEVAQGVPGRLRPRIFLTFGTTRVVGHQPYALAAFTPGEVPGTHFQRLSQPQGTWFRQGYHGKNPQWQHRESIPGPSD